MIGGIQSLVNVHNGFTKRVMRVIIARFAFILHAERHTYTQQIPSTHVFLTIEGAVVARLQRIVYASAAVTSICMTMSPMRTCFTTTRSSHISPLYILIMPWLI